MQCTTAHHSGRGRVYRKLIATRNDSNKCACARDIHTVTPDDLVHVDCKNVGYGLFSEQMWPKNLGMTSFMNSVLQRYHEHSSTVFPLVLQHGMQSIINM